MSMTKVGLLVTMALFLVTFAGCGESGPVVHTVNGTVSHQGDPVTDVVVVFAPADGSRPSYGNVDDQGRFTMLFTEDRPGVAAGDHVVYLMPPSATPDQKPPSPTMAALLEKYKEGSSPYKITVDEPLDDFELELD